MSAYVLSFLNSHIALPFVAFKILQLNAQHVVLVIGEHVDVFISEPELFSRVTKAVLVIGPVTVEVLAWLAEVIASLDYLNIGLSSDKHRHHIRNTNCIPERVYVVP
jgi:hypothetical protein